MAEAIQNLNESALQIVLVVSPEKVLLGTLTDGDIRRALLRGIELNSTLEEAIQRDPVVVPPDLPLPTVLQLMQINKVQQLPIVDNGRHVVGLHLWNTLIAPPQRPNLMVIMAGGEGKRLRPYTENCPKPLLEIGGKPILEHIIERAIKAGFQHFVLSVHYLAHMIEDYFGNGSKWNIKIEYLKEESPLGTAGAINFLKPLPEQPFVVCNADVLTDINYGDLVDFHIHHAAMATMAVRLYEWQHPFGVVHTKGVDVLDVEEKPLIRNHVNAGIYVLSPEIFKFLEAGQYYDMPQVIKKITNGGKRAIVYPMHEPWLDIGRPADFELAKKKKSTKND